MTQCPIVPEESYLYDFNVSQQVRILLATTCRLDGACQAGTFWYHSHVSTQYGDGLRGPLVVYDTQDPHANLYDVDDGVYFPGCTSDDIHFLGLQNLRSLLLQTGEYVDYS